MSKGTDSMALTFLRQQNDELFKENHVLKNRLLDIEVRLGEKLSNRACCGGKEI